MNLRSVQFLMFCIASILALIFLTILVSMFTYFNANTFEKDNENKVVAVTENVAEYLQFKLDNYSEILNAVGMSLGKGGAQLYTEAEVDAIIAGCSNTLSQSEFTLIYDEALTAGHQKAISNRVDLKIRQQLATGESGIVTTDGQNNSEKYINLVSPTSFMIQSDGGVIPIRGLCATFSAEEVIQQFFQEDFNNKGSLCILGDFKNGKYERLFTDEYIKDIFDGTGIINAKSMSKSQQEIDEAISQSKSILLTLQHDNEKAYLSLIPIGINDWYLANVVPKVVVSAQTNDVFNAVVIACFAVIFVIAVLVVVLSVLYKTHRRELENVAYTDPLTGGFNTLKFVETVKKELMKHTDQRYALVYTNIEKFKLINESYGRDTGDEILRKIFNLIKEDLKAGEFIGRLGEDKFGVLIKYNDRECIIQRLLGWDNMIDACKIKDASNARISMVFGIYRISDHAQDVNRMIDKASMARNMANRSYGEPYSFYNEVIKRKQQEERELEGLMSKALVNGEFQVYLQPQYRLSDNVIIGAELLTRWNSPEKGFLTPDKFIPLFERNGFIVKLDSYVLHKACEYIRGWMDAGLTPIKLSVNISRYNLNNPEFFDRVIDTIAEVRVPSKYLEFEFLESMAYDDLQYLSNLIDKIHNLGARVALDDFGSGYSALNLLKDINVDELKIDRSFFIKYGDKRGMDIVRCIIDIGKKLGIEVLSEGIETEEQIEFLRANGCDYVQGFYYSKAVKKTEFDELAVKELHRLK